MAASGDRDFDGADNDWLCDRDDAANMITIKNLQKDWKEFSLKGINLEVKRGEYFVILGPTGAGKTLLLETIAGFYFPDRGGVWVAGREVTKLPPEKRGIGFIYQDYSLFPHFTVEENIEFGLKLKKSRSRSGSRSGSRGGSRSGSRTEELMKWLGITHLEGRYPATLSGGEQQKVAIARAVAIEPEILLLDEPLSALDFRTREYLREELRRVKKELGLGITMVHVTHDQTEAMVLADRIAVMMNGRIMQVGAPHEIFNKPKNEEIADFVGVENILSGVVRKNENGVAEVEVVSGGKAGGKVGDKVGDKAGGKAGGKKGCNIFAVSEYRAGAVKVLLRPEEVILSKRRSGGKGESSASSASSTSSTSSARNAVKGKIEELTDLGPLTRVRTDAGLVALVTKQSRESLELREGDEVFATFKATSVHLVR